MYNQRYEDAVLVIMQDSFFKSYTNSELHTFIFIHSVEFIVIINFN